MKTAAEREAEFRADLKVLLDKHGADMDIADEGNAYGHGSMPVCTITMISTHDDYYITTGHHCEFNL